MMILFLVIGRCGSEDAERAKALQATIIARAHEKKMKMFGLIGKPTPTPSRPFVFFHQRKTGGSSIRKMLVESAKGYDLTFRVQCFGGVHCNSYDVPLNLGLSAVYGGHLYFPSAVKAIHQQTVRSASFRPVQEDDYGFDCLTIFREPVSRVQSCWNYRFPPAARAFNSYGVEEIRRMLPLGMSFYDEGCNNEPLRILSDSGRSEQKVNVLTSNLTDAAVFDPKSGWAFDAVGTLARTFEHMETCVIGVLERCEETEKVIAFYFPWFDRFSCSVHLNVNSKHKPASDLHPDVVDEVKRQNALEVLAYETANAMLDAQLRIINETERT